MIKNIKISELPSVIPIFPLPGAIVMPNGTLPLNIFEPRYVAMIEAVLGTHRIIGMIQPKYKSEHNLKSLYPVGCAGKIISFSETSDKRYLIELKGVIRFKVEKEVELINGYRNIIPNWSFYKNDLSNKVEDIEINPLLKELQIYFNKNNINVDFSEISKIPYEQVIASVPQICSFKTSEKQAILEAKSLKDRVKVLISLLKMYSTLSNDQENETIN